MLEFGFVLKKSNTWLSIKFSYFNLKLKLDFKPQLEFHPCANFRHVAPNRDFRPFPDLAIQHPFVVYTVLPQVILANSWMILLVFWKG